MQSFNRENCFSNGYTARVQNFLKTLGMWPLVLRTSDFIRKTRLALRRPELECPIDPGATVTMCQVRSGHVSSGLAGLGEVKWGQVRSVRVRSSQTGSLTWLSRRRQPPWSASGRRAGWWSADRSSQSHCKTTDRWRYTHSIGKDTRTEHWTLRGNMGSKPRSERSR